jgi:hypothetical protein
VDDGELSSTARDRRRVRRAGDDSIIIELGANHRRTYFTIPPISLRLTQIAGEKKSSPILRKKRPIQPPKKKRQSLSLSFCVSPVPVRACVRACVSLSHKHKQNHTHDDKVLMSHCSCHALFVIADSSMNRRHVPRLEKCAISSFAAGVEAEGGNCALVVLRFSPENGLVVGYNHPPPNTHE